MSIPAILRTIAPALNKTDDELQVWIDMAKPFVGQGVWGSKYETGVAYMAAHLATVSMRGDKGTLSSKTVGSVSESYANHGTEALASTSFGATFLGLRKTVSIGPIIRGGYV